MLIDEKNKDLVQENKTLILSENEWTKFEKEIKNPKPATKELKKLITSQSFK